jgi:hypothetical protein
VPRGGRVRVRVRVRVVHARAFRECRCDGVDGAAARADGLQGIPQALRGEVRVLGRPPACGAASSSDKACVLVRGSIMTVSCTYLS